MRRFTLYLLFTFTIIFKSVVAQDFGAYQALLNKYLKEEISQERGIRSAFDYELALSDPNSRELIAQQKKILDQFNPSGLSERASFNAFWINAYNFFMLVQILENPNSDGKVVSSVRDFGWLFDYYRIFKMKKFTIGEKLYSLDQIEKEILLGTEAKEKQFKDARVHFAVNCASVGCPPLRQRVYTVENIELLLTENTQLALKTKIHYERQEDKIYLTRLFDWYERDFQEEAGSNLDFIMKYVSESEREILKKQKFKIHFRSYDWSLNSPSNVFTP